MSQLKQIPASGVHIIYFRGDTVTFWLESSHGKKGRAWIRTNLGHADVRHSEIVRHTEEESPLFSRDWHDYPMKSETAGRFYITLPLLGVGRFEAKAYFIEEGSEQIQWPEGGNSVIKVEPADTCACNTMYTAFVRLFGAAKYKRAVNPEEEAAVKKLDEAGYTVLPKSGTFRDMIGELDFIIGVLRCRIIQLLPIHPVPTTYARMGRFGSPFAVMDLMDVDPSLAEFDRRTTPIDQFQELADEVHKRHARIFLDLPINHTGWASHLQIQHPEWFCRHGDGSFLSPGAWGVLWEDLSKLEYSNRSLWRYMADVFLYWCHRGVDGFRCDAGYKVPFETWQYIVAKVRLEYPDTIFMLEGLGGYKHVTERLLADSGMNWAYSEIFQNHDQTQVDGYLPESIRVSESKGNLIHFCETHDNARLAETSHVFARLRAAFCALTSQNGAFGFANGVEWYAKKKINVHNAHSINWGSEPNMIDWLRRLHAIMEIHPAFHAGASVKIVTCGKHNSSALLRADISGEHRLLVLANLNHEAEGRVEWFGDYESFRIDLISTRPARHRNRSCPLLPGETLCLTESPEWLDRIAQPLETPFAGSKPAVFQCMKAKAMEVFHHFGTMEACDTARFSAAPKAVCEELAGGAPVVVTWQWPQDTRRTVLIPPGHFLLVKSAYEFIAELKNTEGKTLAHEKSFMQPSGQSFVLFQPLETPRQHTNLTLKLTVFSDEAIRHTASPLMLLCLQRNAMVISTCQTGAMSDGDRYAVCANACGAFSQVRLGWAQLRSKYDALLSANLDPEVPIDRHTMFARCRGWVVRRGYSHELSLYCQKRFTVVDGRTVVWDFAVPVGEGRMVLFKIVLQLHPETNAVKCTFLRKGAEKDPEKLADDQPITLILRADIEDRSNHEVTQAMHGAEECWPNAVRPLKRGFIFAPAPERKLQVELKGGSFHFAPEWYYQIDHPVDRTRGMEGKSDLYSPGYFILELQGGECAELSAGINGMPEFEQPKYTADQEELTIEEAMLAAMRQFIVKRGRFRTVIAGYPWFLDWGRDTLICLRGIIAAGLLEEARDIFLQFAKYEQGGTIPNMIRGSNTANRETSDAPLWMFVACSELMKAQQNRKLIETDCGEGRTVKEVLISLASSLIAGTSNGIVLDKDSGLIYSPPHYTWMDTNYPAGTPRQGYPIEIQAMWKYALNILSKIDDAPEWSKWSVLVERSLKELFHVEFDGVIYLADCLVCESGTGAHDAAVDDALRPNQLLAVTLDAVTDSGLCRSILEACESLLVPGAIRSLADRSVHRPAPIYHHHRLLNNPSHPYWGHYEGDEDTRRKPAYHNGTAWTWLFPSYAEALVKVYGEGARETALAILASAAPVLNHGCLRQNPEVLDGDTPHTQRGSGAQAWGVTELYRVIKKLNEPG